VIRSIDAVATSATRPGCCASFTLLAAVGRLSPQVLGLRMPVYDANVHYQ